jgi:hypothetical protein
VRQSLVFWPPTRIWRRQPRFAPKSSLKFSRPAAANQVSRRRRVVGSEGRVRQSLDFRSPTSVLRSRRVVDSERRVAKSRLPAANQVLRSRRVVDSKGRVRQNLGLRSPTSVLRSRRGRLRRSSCDKVSSFGRQPRIFALPSRVLPSEGPSCGKHLDSPPRGQPGQISTHANVERKSRS